MLNRAPELKELNTRLYEAAIINKIFKQNETEIERLPKLKALLGTVRLQNLLSISGTAMDLIDDIQDEYEQDNKFKVSYDGNVTVRS